jgi:hypothetical protein
MRSHVPRGVGLVLAAFQGVLLAQSVLIVPIVLIGDRTAVSELDPPLDAGDYVLAFSTTAAATTLGAALLFAAWKIWRTPSRAWLAVGAVLVAVQPLVWLYDERLNGDFDGLRGLLLPVASLVLLLWPAPHARTAAQAPPQSLTRP